MTTAQEHRTQFELDNLLAKITPAEWLDHDLPTTDEGDQDRDWRTALDNRESFRSLGTLSVLLNAWAAYEAEREKVRVLRDLIPGTDTLEHAIFALEYVKEQCVDGLGHAAALGTLKAIQAAPRGYDGAEEVLAATDPAQGAGV